MIEIEKLNFEKQNGLLPAIIVDVTTDKVLMLGFMNNEALQQTVEKQKVVFFSRTKNKLWLKGETSGNYLNVVSIESDCDDDTLLIYANPDGPTCHTGNYSCFAEVDKNNIKFLDYLFKLVKQRKIDLPENSYTTTLFNRGSDRIIQKVGEESVETVIAAKNKDREEIVNETSDLIFHLFVMLADQGIEFSEIISNLQKRHSDKK
ncbi:MAG: bifunctional phosphoribosyl-AMP cyclohydrolase/phosphoribosyl-ATP diphosphatase HisIE [Ignavibacteriae bacterium]|nr:bifunctional phosphoribosyl-AMP cyclohydrolase/phosphoribosyl-ATP diphosphatase HisIE [Ignavibacteriota bacterium]MCB9258244.1 bifunctional phosphoribosyl-AMP cyclohydrolase/phosphoribosyl-ATP diphosphatase HisIE [Ignavibacteriales bacterium]